MKKEKKGIKESVEFKEEYGVPKDKIFELLKAHHRKDIATKEMLLNKRKMESVLLRSKIIGYEKIECERENKELILKIKQINKENDELIESISKKYKVDLNHKNIIIDDVEYRVKHLDAVQPDV